MPCFCFFYDAAIFAIDVFFAALMLRAYYFSLMRRRHMFLLISLSPCYVTLRLRRYVILLIATRALLADALMRAFRCC